MQKSPSLGARANNPATRLLLVDDDANLCQLLKEYFESEGFSVQAMHLAAQGVEHALREKPDVMVLDVNLPDFNGFDALRRIRSKSSVPVLMLTARADELDRIVGLEIGADDYLSKPFNPRELVARIRAVLRRTNPTRQALPAMASTECLVVADVELQIASRRVLQDGAGIELTGTQFMLLEHLLRSAGRVISRQELTRAVLGRHLSLNDRCIDVHISNLRKKLGHTIEGVKRIQSVRGTGYVYAVPGDPGRDNRN